MLLEEDISIILYLFAVHFRICGTRMNYEPFVPNGGKSVNSKQVDDGWTVPLDQL